MQWTHDAYSIPMDAESIEALCRSISDWVEKFVSKGREPVILCSSNVRPHLRRLLSPIFPKLAILSYQEISPHTKVESMGVIDIEVEPVGVGKEKAGVTNESQ
mgnify:FL=1